MHVACNNEARSSSHCCSGKAINVTHSACVCSLSYPACKAHAPYNILICGLSGSTIFLRIFSETARFGGGGGGESLEHKMWVLIFFTTLA